MTWRWLAPLVGGVLVAVACFLLLQAWSHYLVDDAAFHQQLVPLLNYNLQQGRLLPLPTPMPPVPVVQPSPQAPSKP